MKMKAAIYYGPGDIRVEEVERPRANPEGVVLSIKACGVCNIMDISAWERWVTNKVGRPMGHEYSGEVVEVGSQVTGVEVGDRIYQLPFIPCYQCEACRVGDYWRCVNWGGEGIHEQAFAEYLWLPFITDQSHVKLPKTLSYHDLALIEPLELSIGLARKAKAGDVVVVLGQEVMGLGTVVKLKEKGVAEVITSDISQKRLEASREIGADVVIDALNEDVVQAVMKETSGEGADVVIVTDPRPVALLQAFGAARRMGKIWLATDYGAPLMLNPSLPSIKAMMTRYSVGPDAGYTELPLTFDPSLVSLQTAWGTLGLRLPRWLEAVELMQSGKITAAKHVTHVFPLDKIKEAFEVARKPHESIKVLVEP